LAIASLSFSFVSAQLSDCQIKYKVDLSGSDMPAMAKLMMGNTKMELAFKGMASRMVMDMGMMGNTTVITDDKTKNGLMLMNMMGRKYATPMKGEDYDQARQEAPDMDFKVTGKTKNIAGYSCKQAIGKDEAGNTYECWYTEKIRPQGVSNFTYKGIDGFPLELEMLQDGVKMKMVAQSVNTAALTDEHFSMKIPSGYTEKSMEDLQKMGNKF
jgi:GLPGLI family protein